MSISYLIGFQAAAFGYFGAFRHLKLYVGLPLTVITYALSRNFVLKTCMNRLYYPVEPLYEEVRNHRSVSKATPKGAVGVRDIEKVTQMLSEE